MTDPQAEIRDLRALNADQERRTRWLVRAW